MQLSANLLLIGLLLPLQLGAAKPASSLWSRKLGPAAGSIFLDVEAGTVITETWDHRLLALDAATGKTRWSRRLGGDRYGDRPMAVHAGRIVYVGAEPSELTALRVQDGERAWEISMWRPIDGLAACGAQRVLVATQQRAGGDVAQAIDAVEGTVLWAGPVPGPVLAGGDDFVVVDRRQGAALGFAFVACASGALQPLQAASRQGRLLWAGAGHAVVRWGDRLCAHGRDGRRRCLPLRDRATWREAPLDGKGRPQPHSDYGTLSGGLLRGSVIYFGRTHLAAHNLDPRPDAWLFAWDLDAERLIFQSEPLTSNVSVIDAGASLLTAFGTTGAADHAHLIDPETGARLRTLALPKMAQRLAVGAQRAYVATYGGRVMAMELTAPGPRGSPLAIVPPRSTTGPAQIAAGPPAPAGEGACEEGFRLRRLRVIDAHPKRATTSGSKTDGTVGALAFVGPKGRAIAAGGNDNKLRLFDTESGQRLYRSKPFRKDLTQIASCGLGWVAGRDHSGRVRLFRPKGRGLRPARRLKLGFGWTLGLSGDCRWLVADDGAAFRIYDPESGQQEGVVRFDGRIDLRGLRVSGQELAVPQPAGVQSAGVRVVGVDPTRRQTRRQGWLSEVPHAEDGARLVQLRALPKGGLLVEHCGAAGCAVRILDAQGAAQQVLRFPRGAWSPGVPSRLEVSSDGRYLFFLRDELEAQVVRLADGQRESLGTIPRTMSATPQARFSPYDPGLLAVAMTPKPHQITLYRVEEPCPAPRSSPQPSR